MEESNEEAEVSELVRREAGDLERTGPWTAPEIVGSVVQAVQSTAPDMVIPGQWRALIGKNAKQMLADGVPPETVIAASFMAILRGKPQASQYIAGDLMLAASGVRMSEREYQTKLRMYEADQSSRRNLLDEQRQRMQARDARADQARSGDVR